MSAGQTKQSATTATRTANARDTVAASLIAGVVTGAKTLGLDTPNCLRSVGLSSKQLEIPTARIDYEKFSSLLLCLKDGSKDEAVGVKLGGELAISSFNALGYAAASCETLFDAFRLIPKYESLIMTLGNTEIIERREGVEARWSMKGGRYLGMLEDLFLATWVTLAKMLTGREGVSFDVHFTHQAPADLLVWQDMFGGNLSFNQEVAGILVDGELLQTPILKPDPFVYQVMTKEADGLASAIKEQSIADQVTQWIIVQLLNGEPDQKVLAAHMNVSERTLRRRLHQEGVSYQQILEMVRKERANYYLTETTISLLEISMLLGYQQLTAFNAAYKRWTGRTPGSMRSSL